MPYFIFDRSEEQDARDHRYGSIPGRHDRQAMKEFLWPGLRVCADFYDDQENGDFFDDFDQERFSREGGVMVERDRRLMSPATGLTDAEALDFLRFL